MYQPATDPAADAEPAAPYPVIRQPLAPFEPAPDTLGAGWRNILPFGATVPRPFVSVTVLAPVDPDRPHSIAELGVAGLTQEVRERAAALPHVAAVRETREQIAAAKHRADQAEAALAKAEEESQAALNVDGVDGPTLYAAAQHAKAVAMAKIKAAQAEAARLQSQLAKAIGPADASLRAFVRSAAEMRFRQRQQDLLAAIKQLPAEVFEQILCLHAAASSLAANGGDGVFSAIRGPLLGADVGPEGLAILPDAVDTGVLEFPAEVVLPATGEQDVEVVETATPDGGWMTTRRYHDTPAAPFLPDPVEPAQDVIEHDYPRERDLTPAELAAEGIFAE